ncbi:MAG: integrase core domain-containing protein [Streptosporangiaceae bacterium]
MTALSNATCERLIGTLRRELLDRTLILNQAPLQAVLAEYQEHYNTARPHQGIGQRIPDHNPAPRAPRRPRHLPDPPKTCPERPDQRVQASRLKPGRPGQSPNPISERHRTGALNAYPYAEVVCHVPSLRGIPGGRRAWPATRVFPSRCWSVRPRSPTGLRRVCWT